MTRRCAATYRLQLGPGLGFAEARALVPYLRDLGVSHLYLSPSFQARTGSTHGYDVVDPTRISDGARRRGGVPRARRGGARGRARDRARHRPEPHGDRRREPLWADPELRAKFFDVDPETGRHRRFFDIDHLAGVRQEDPEVFEETHRLALALVREGLVDGLRIDHPDGLADPAGYLRRLRDARRRARLGREDPRPGRAAARLAGRRARSATSSSTTSRRCSSTRRARSR